MKKIILLAVLLFCCAFSFAHNMASESVPLLQQDFPVASGTCRILQTDNQPGTLVYQLNRYGYVDTIKDLKPFAEAKREKNAMYQIDNPWRPSGVACPRCGKELLEHTCITLTSYPPQTPVKCSVCSFTGML
jgi:hypothetical protein